MSTLSKPGTTTFSGQVRPSVNFVERTGARFGMVELTTPGYSGNWFGQCHGCGHEALYTKNEIRRAVFKCRGCGR